MEESLGLARPVHAAPLRRIARARLPRRPGRVPDPRRGRCLPRAVRRTFRAAGGALDARALAEQGRRRLRGRRERHARFARDAVVVATGPFHAPIVPDIAGGLAAEVFQTHSAGYRRPADLPEGRVLVVGGGNTGFQIAKELAGSREVHLAIGSQQKPLPQRLLGRDLFWWLTKLGAAVEVRRFPDRPARARPRHPDRVEPARCEAPWRRRAVARGRRGRPHGPLRRRHRARCRRGDLGDGLPNPTTRGSTCRSTATTAAYAIAAASATFPGSTSSVCPGNTRAAPHCSDSSPTTRRSSQIRSPPTARLRAEEHRSPPRKMRAPRRRLVAMEHARASARARRHRRDRHVPDRDCRPSTRGADPGRGARATATPSSFESRRSRNGSATTPCG